MKRMARLGCICFLYWFWLFPPPDLWEMWESRAAFARLFQAAVGIRVLCGFPHAAAFSTGFFVMGRFCFLTISLRGRRARSRYESATPLFQRLEETFERDRRREPNVYSDVVLRGLDYKVYAHSLLACSSAKELKESILSKQNVELAAFIGLDWADQQHVVCLQDAEGSSRETSTLDQTPEGLQAWIHQLRARFGGRPVAVAVEQARGALIYALMHVDFLHLYPVNPQTLAKLTAGVLSQRGQG